METVHNPKFAELGSFYSLQVGLERAAAAGPLLILESDLVYEPRALDEVLADPHEDVVLLSGPTASGDEVWVETDGDARLVAMSKDRGVLGAGVAGELVGITRVSPALAALLRALPPEGEYEVGGLVAASKRRPVYCRRVADLQLGRDRRRESHGAGAQPDSREKGTKALSIKGCAMNLRSLLGRVVRALRRRRHASTTRDVDAIYRLLYQAVHDLDHAMILAAESTQASFRHQWTSLKEGISCSRTPGFARTWIGSSPSRRYRSSLSGSQARACLTLDAATVDGAMGWPGSEPTSRLST